MESKIELFVNGPSTGTTQGQIDLFGDEPISLNYSVLDIKDISKRNSSYSQAFTVPATKNNNILFNHIFNIGSDSSYDPSKKIPSYLLVDSLMVIQGNLQLVKIKVKDRNPVSYDVVIYGEAIDLVKSLGDGFLTDLDYSDLNHNRDAETLQNSWTANTSTLGYYYPLVDYSYDLDIIELNSGALGQKVDNGSVTTANVVSITDISKSWVTNIYGGNKYTVSIIGGTGKGQSRNIFSNNGNVLTIAGSLWTVVPDATSIYTINLIITNNPLSSNGGGMKPSLFKPAISNTWLMNKIFNDKGFVIDSDFINNNPIFNETIIPFSGKDIGNQTEDIHSFQAFLQDGYSVVPTNIGTALDFPFNDEGQDVMNLYNTTTFTYTAPVSGLEYEFYVNLQYRYNKTAWATGDRLSDNIIVDFFRSSSPFPFGTTPIFAYLDVCPEYPNALPIPNGTALAAIQNARFVSNKITLAAGETVTCKIRFDSTLSLYQIYTNESVFYNRVYTNGAVNNYIYFNDWIIPKIKQVDYVKSNLSLFNLLVIPNKNNPKKLTIIPKDDYYAAGKVVEWNIDESYGVEETLLSEQQSREIKFSYTPDKDFYNTKYTSETNKTFGDYSYYVNNEWLDSKSLQNIKVIFSPTPMENVDGSEDIIVSKISKVDNNGTYGETDANIRLLRKNKTLRPTTDTIKILGLPSQHSYPYAGHLSDPFSQDSSTIDYNFGQIDYAFYNTPGFSNLQTITPNNLVELYWKNTLDDINDKNSKLIKCKVKLNSSQVEQLNYNDIISIKGITDDGTHLFFLNKLTYIPTTNDTSLVELIKINRKPSIKSKASLLNTVTDSPKRNSLALNGAIVDNAGSIGVGKGTYISPSSPNSFVFGSNNVIGDNSAGTFLNGSNNIIENVSDSFIIGNNNMIMNPSGSTGTTISGVTLLGVSNYTATTSDTVYVPNIQFTTTGGTINGVAVTAITQSVIGGNLWTSGSTGLNSIKANNGTTDALGDYAVAIGYSTIASGLYSHAEGSYSTASGDASHVEGSNTTASGDASHSEGYNTIASDDASHAEGYSTIASGGYSHAEGSYSRAIGDYSHAEGQSTTASGYYSHAEGYSTTASGDGSHAEGYQTTASGSNSHAEGYQTTAIGLASHSEGSGTTATGNTSHAEGYQTTASGDYSHAEGSNTTAGGGYSHAEGYQTTASGFGSHAGGIYSNTNNTAEWVRSGNGGYGQYGFVDFFGATTNSVLTEIYIAGGINERLIIPIDTAFRYRLIIIARIIATGAVKEWEAKGLIKNVGGTTSMVGSNNTSTYADASLATAYLGVMANNINDNLHLEATGIAATNIKWYGRLEYVKVL